MSERITAQANLSRMVKSLASPPSRMELIAVVWLFTVVPQKVIAAELIALSRAGSRE